MAFAIQHELESWGPTAAAGAVSLAEAERYCRQLATSHYENFPLASCFLPRRLHQHFFNVYAYCRWSDDLADEVGDREASTLLLHWWRGELDACYAGRATHPVFVALRPTIERFQIPQSPFADLISAFEQDQVVLDYGTFVDLRDYCRRSADPVGRLVLYLCERFSPERAELSDLICTGLQLANFWQDVGRDLDLGRIYIPREDRERFGYNDDTLHARVTNPEFLDLMRFEVDRAQQFLEAGLPLVTQLPGRLQVDIELFARGGLTILKRIRQQNYRVWDSRPVVTKRDFAGLFVGCLARWVCRGGWLVR